MYELQALFNVLVYSQKCKKSHSRKVNEKYAQSTLKVRAKYVQSTPKVRESTHQVRKSTLIVRIKFAKQHFMRTLSPLFCSIFNYFEVFARFFELEINELLTCFVVWKNFRIIKIWKLHF